MQGLLRTPSANRKTDLGHEGYDTNLHIFVIAETLSPKPQNPGLRSRGLLSFWGSQEFRLSRGIGLREASPHLDAASLLSHEMCTWAAGSFIAPADGWRQKLTRLILTETGGFTPIGAL